MKKIIALFITLFYSCSNALAFSELYYLKNIHASDLNNTIKNAYSSQQFNLKKENPYYGISAKNSENYAVVILQQSGENLFYYFQSDKNKRINRCILRDIKSSGVALEESFNSNLLGIFENLAGQVINPSTAKQYTFEEPSYNTAATTVQKKNNNTLSGYVAQIEKGTKFDVYLQNPINTSTAQVGDSVVAVLTNDWTYNGYTVAPQGSFVYGSLTLAHPAQYASRNGRVVINFDKIITPNGKTLNIKTEKIDFSVDNEGKFSSSVKNVAAGAIIGAIGGLIIGALAGGDHLGRSVAIGAGVGAGSAAVSSTVEKGVDAEIPSFTELELVLADSMRVTLSD